jgi:serine/threonine protein kinase
VYDADARTCPVDGELLLAEEARAAGDKNARTAAGRVTPRRSTPAAPAVNTAPTAGALPSLADEELSPELVAAAVRDDGLKPGSQVGEYKVNEKIGEGGMGTVYAGVHPVIGKKVAIKLLNLGLSQDPGIVQRFVQEARAVNQIGHRNIVDIFAFGALDNGRHYYVMEFLNGRNLKRRLDDEPALSYAEAFTVLIEVADALAAAHNEGIVHRDLKPDNIYLVESKTGEQTVKLLDFGIAKLLRRGEGSGQGQTRTGAPLGTPYYMSPEQCRSKNVDARTDLYAMGVIMFEVFTGKLPFPGPDYIDTVNGHLSHPPPLPSDFADVPVELEALMLSCLEKDPDKRPQTAVELRNSLRQVAQSAGVQVVPLSSGPHAQVPGTPSQPVRRVTPRSHPTLPSAPFRRVTPAPRPASSFPTAVLIGVAVLGLLGGGVAWFVRTPKSAAVQAPAAADTIELAMTTDPAGATVLLNGRRQATLTPATYRVPRSAEIAVRVELAGYQPHDELVQVAAGETSHAATIKLQPLSGELRVHSNARDAQFKLDGNAVAGVDGALELKAVPAGAHKLRVEAKGFDPREEEIKLDPGQKLALEWTLTAAGKHRTPKPGALPDAPNMDFKAPK